MGTTFGSFAVSIGTAAALVATPTEESIAAESTTTNRSVVPLDDPPPLLTLSNLGKKNGKDEQRLQQLQIPRVGYSLFKTAPEQTERCVLLALLAGVTHLDMATQYNNTAQVGLAVQRYLGGGGGRSAVRDYLQRTESPELLSFMDQTYRRQRSHTTTNKQSSRRFTQLASGAGGNEQRLRQGLFLSYKISNAEQSTDPTEVKAAVHRAILALPGVNYLDMVSIHSPLTDSKRRLATYQTLLELQQNGLIRAIGVCNYGLGPLQELERSGLPPPSVDQLELSPFQTHCNVVDYCNDHGIAVACSAWSRLSSADGPIEQWDQLSRIATQQQWTKAQVLVRWALQNGYICVPRSASASKLERMAIAENSYGGVQSSHRLTPEELQLLDSLNINYKAGRLNRKDGWMDADVTGAYWDPTDTV